MPLYWASRVMWDCAIWRSLAICSRMRAAASRAPATSSCVSAMAVLLCGATLHPDLFLQLRKLGTPGPGGRVEREVVGVKLRSCSRSLVRSSEARCSMLARVGSSLERAAFLPDCADC
jgi:hypothetical protein